MSVVSVRARSFILALFIRDDGERFLLGDNGFDFKDSQLHFSANTIENDEVAKQGVDGVMLAGQVRRASVQSFDGYVGDGSTLKEEVEQMRRDFIAFFAKGHHFRVIYIDCNRNAWQRKGGYLVDAPEVKELWQIHPEYHVGLNFEDVNYYEYDENAEGEEILSNIISVPISSDVEGGLVWDENGAVSEPEEIGYDTETATASGTNISIADAVEAPLSDFKLKGNTSQNGTPTPDAPVAVQTVTGENVVKITGKNLIDQSLIESSTFHGLTISATPEKISVSGTTDTSYPAWVFYADGTVSRTQWWPTASTVNTTKGQFCNETPHTLSINVGGASVGYQKIAYFVGYMDGTWSGNKFIPEGATSVKITTEKAVNFIAFGFRGGSETFNNTLQLQLELGSTATAYEPYQGQSYPISLGSIELCKIGDYQDYIYKDGTDWKIHKAVGKYTFTGNESPSVDTASTNTTRCLINNCLPADAPSQSQATGTGKSNYFEYRTNWSADVAGIYSNNRAIVFRGAKTTIGTTQAAVKTWIASTMPMYYYALATPTDTEITNEALIAQLEAILQGHTYAGTNNITTVIAAGNEQGELEITYYTKYDAKVVGGGYVWEAGGSGGPTIVTNESISAVSPVWTVFGPALNPMLENTTTGEQIQYVDMISEGQTLVVDMGEQTASLDGLNVISNIVGEYLTLAPGSNTLLFSADSDAPASEIGWSEIVG